MKCRLLLYLTPARLNLARVILLSKSYLMHNYFEMLHFDVILYQLDHNALNAK